MSRLRGFALVVFLFLSCSGKTPSGVIPPEKMEKILTQLHMADVAYKLDLLPQNYKGKPDSYLVDVLAYYETDTATYNKSILWYAEHPKMLQKIYLKVEKNILQLQQK